MGELVKGLSWIWIFREFLDGAENTAGLATAIEHEGQMNPRDSKLLGGGLLTPSLAAELISSVLDLRASLCGCFGVHVGIKSVSRYKRTDISKLILCKQKIQVD